MVSPTELANLLRAAFTQANRLLRLETPLGPNVLLPERLDAAEHLDNGGFRLALTALSDDADLDPARLLGQPVRLDLLTQQSRSTLRPFHGHVTQFEQLGANGGLVRYRLVIEPWLAFLRHRRDSFLFQDMSVIEVIDSLFGDYNGQGRLVPAWRWSLRDASVYARRSVITQYEESDFDFVTRLLAEEGLFYVFEHEAVQGDALGVHRMVIADANDVFIDNAQATIRFGRADATASEDVIDRWQGARRWQTNAVSIASWDYRVNAKRSAQLGAQQQREGGPPLTLQDTDYPGQYWFEDSAQAQRSARVMMEALEVRSRQFDGEGSVRTLAPGTRFQLADHYDHGDDGEARFAVLSIRHQARNNFNERFGQVLTQTLGALSGPDAQDGASNAGTDATFYRNHFTVVRDSVPYRPQRSDAQGRALHPRPTVNGGQTALVVGNGGPVHTDRDHRIKVQFHWQRGARSASRQPHPAGDDNARADAGLGSWIRVATPVAGPNWGGVALPRVGQEVLVEFLQGDIDRPVVVGAAYNGTGQRDAQYNQNQAGAAGATGNAPAWFAGDSKSQGAYAHNAVLSGIKTQALAGSQTGASGYNQLVFDDTDGQSRTQLSTTQAATALTLGHHKEQIDSARQADLGHGAALATNDSGSVRAGAGLLLTAHAAGTGAALLDSEGAASQIEAISELAESLADVAQKQKAGLPGEPAAQELPALKQLRHTTEVLRHAESAGEGASAIAYSEPHLQVSAPKGIAAATPADAMLVAGTQATLIAKQDATLAAGGNLAMAVADGMTFFAHGMAVGQSSDAAAGIAMHAASGKVGLSSLKGESRLVAEKAVTVASTQGNVMAEAKAHVRVNAAGAQIKVTNGTIELHAPGKTVFKGAGHTFVGPGGGAASNALAQGNLKGCGTQEDRAAGEGAGSASR
ncbi:MULTISPECIES: type VI secretion system Vgr family protein [Ralstonia solanacearum species complex]|uniref:type VI secretion system Vgr family protein n=1 Tax=Ralstonia solanacearum species complex TaxID=3116862 RepID=UPI000E58E947|nr:type VI secretion system Vgr family protein [Ralstonia solanacearum]BEU74273.1 type VI secretion system Vgr family protein [Ralstonia pseudosolanacearum]AXV79153.1 type VI secretion protein [Ralstonia solanacearum]AXV93175.1 type VI secretion protein [Ralstonia solanacearum]AXW21224.1 type VI secretion protein [Ralstonia solanacearum]AXW78071.1 type VI secretion protein [Ralstonia solanacearum]